MDGEAHDIPEALVPHLTHLKAAYEALRAAREKRGTLDLDMPERRALISEDRTQVLAIAERTMGPANQLIEEMMVLANVACARAFAAWGARAYTASMMSLPAIRCRRWRKFWKARPPLYPPKRPS